MGWFEESPRTFAAIDVGSHTLKGMAFERLRDLPPRVIKKAAYRTPHSAKFQRTAAKMHEFLFALAKQLGKIPERIVISLGPNVGAHELVYWSVSSPAGIKISGVKELQSYFQELFNSHRDSEHAMLAYPLELYANGYPSTIYRDESTALWPRKLSGVQELGFQTLLFSPPAEIGEELLNIKNTLGGMPVEFVPRVAVYKEALAKAAKISHLFFIEVGGEETTLLLLKEGILRQQATFPLGSRHFFRGIAKHFKISLEEAEELKQQYTKGITGETVRSRLRVFLLTETGIWEKMFLETLGSFYQAGPLPADVLVTGEGARFPEILERLRSAAWLKEFSDASAPSIKIFEAQNVFEGNTLGGTLQGPEEIGLAALIYYSIYHTPLF